MGRNTKSEKEEKRIQTETMKITKYVRFNIPNKKCKIRKEEFDYFTAHDAIDTLMNSKFFTKDGHNIPKADRKQGKLYTRDDAIMFFKHVVFNRMAARCMKKFKEPNAIEETNTTSKKDQKESSGLNLKKVDAKSKLKDEEENNNTDNDEKIKKKKKKFKMNPHPTQGFFDDSEEVYIWIYNPTPFKHWIYGFLVLLVVIGGTLFPLWPDTLRTGVYYTSISLAGFIGSILVIGLARTILFGILWGLTAGKHNLWILPNLLADVGFFESFQPLYTYEVVGKEKKKIKDKSEKTKKGESEKTDQIENSENTSENDEISGSDKENASPKVKKDQ